MWVPPWVQTLTIPENTSVNYKCYNTYSVFFWQTSSHETVAENVPSGHFLHTVSCVWLPKTNTISNTDSNTEIEQKSKTPPLGKKLCTFYESLISCFTHCVAHTGDTSFTGAVEAHLTQAGVTLFLTHVCHPLKVFICKDIHEQLASFRLSNWDYSSAITLSY